MNIRGVRRLEKDHVLAILLLYIVALYSVSSIAHADVNCGQRCQNEKCETRNGEVRRGEYVNIGQSCGPGNGDKCGSSGTCQLGYKIDANKDVPESAPNPAEGWKNEGVIPSQQELEDALQNAKKSSMQSDERIFAEPVPPMSKDLMKKFGIEWPPRDDGMVVPSDPFEDWLDRLREFQDPLQEFRDPLREMDGKLPSGAIQQGHFVSHPLGTVPLGAVSQWNAETGIERPTSPSLPSDILNSESLGGSFYLNSPATGFLSPSVASRSPAPGLWQSIKVFFGF